LFLTGGPPQHETWDPKPDAPVEVRGELGSIETVVPGIRIGELFPGVAQVADRLCIVRSVTHHDTVHTSAGYTLLTGVYHPTPNTATAADIRPLPSDHPHLGSILSATQPGDTATGLPPFVALPEVIRDAGVNTFPGQDAGFLGKRHGPFLVEANATEPGFRLPEIALPADISLGRLDERRKLWSVIDREFTDIHGGRSHAPGLAEELKGYYEQAFDVIRAPESRQAFDLSLESDATRAAYGPHLFGQGCLLARRLLEAGVALVTVYWHYDGPEDSPVWDTHQSNARHLRERLAPPTDRALSSLVADLTVRGLLDDTLLICLGEFGRNPRINALGGRDHWPQVQSIVLAGAGVPAGAVYGSSDRKGGLPADRPLAPPDLTATVLHLLGVPPDLLLVDRQGRPHPACAGHPVAELLG
jgi:hypothetical protein